MFFVFGPSGQMYRGGPENLARITSARRVNRPQALRTRGTDEAPPFSLESLLPGGAHPSGAAETAGATAPTGSTNLRAHDAVSAYAQTGHPTPATRQPLSRVRDVMTPRSLTVQPDTIVNHAWQQLAEHGVAQAPVVDARGRVIGLLVRADMAPLDLLPEPGHIQATIALARRPVSAVMVTPVPTVAPDTDVRRLASVLLDTGLPGLPVTDEAGIPVGFVSRTDILRAVAADPPLDLWS
ncbi:MAG TPA: CBS domain-containing protein [Giesbergeria sp.]|nr:CBS domain-containing protein [Giesbergeria sp.]